MSTQQHHEDSSVGELSSHRVENGPENLFTLSEYRTSTSDLEAEEVLMCRSRRLVRDIVRAREPYNCLGTFSFVCPSPLNGSKLGDMVQQEGQYVHIMVDGDVHPKV